MLKIGELSALAAWWKKFANRSPRIELVRPGSTMGKDMTYLLGICWRGLRPSRLGPGHHCLPLRASLTLRQPRFCWSDTPDTGFAQGLLHLRSAPGIMCVHQPVRWAAVATCPSRAPCAGSSARTGGPCCSDRRISLSKRRGVGLGPAGPCGRWAAPWTLCGASGAGFGHRSPGRGGRWAGGRRCEPGKGRFFGQVPAVAGPGRAGRSRKKGAPRPGSAPRNASLPAAAQQNLVDTAAGRLIRCRQSTSQGLIF